MDFDGEPGAVLHVGNDDSITTMLALHFSDSACYGYDPAAKTPMIKQLNPARAKALMRRRRFLIEKVKDTRTIGIIAGTLAVCKLSQSRFLYSSFLVLFLLYYLPHLCVISICNCLRFY
jgi:diphthamide biosynthesis enzyme Dph1/Dph2-like protein